ncbi:SDR family NAD(P)-dependent oxidoreductase [Streptomyces sp. NPDC046821]|uniref:SDR family NAD(P)-dependent oxidoreductase n=1 Tax=Streptomyces sp. NPDC046821 TaxID=3154702 RepID=UPI0033C83DC9
MLSNMGFTGGGCVVISGAGSRIGRVVALGAAELGIAAAVRDLDDNSAAGVAETVENSGGRALAVRVDVSDRRSQPHEIAAPVLFLLSPPASAITGTY